MTWEIFVYPVLVSDSSFISIIRDEVLIADPMVSTFFTIFTIIIFIGVVLFSIALLRTKEFSKVAVVLFLTGAILYAIGGIFIGIIGVVMLGAGSFILGMNFIKSKQETDDSFVTAEGN